MAAGVGVGAFAAGPFFSRSFAADTASAALPPGTGREGHRYVIRGGAVLSMDSAVGDFARADVLVDGKKILAIGPNIDAGTAPVIDAVGRIVMPGFIDTHHHQFETALRSYIPNGLLANDGRLHGAVNYMEYVLGKLAPVYQPEDVYISELFGSLSQLDAGVTTVHDLSQIHHTPAHTDAAIKGIADSGRRTAFSYSESQANNTRFPDEVRRIRRQYFSANDQLLTMVIGSEIYEPGYADTWKLARDLDLPIASHVVGSSMSGSFAAIAKTRQLGPKNLLIHMTLIDDSSWKIAADSGAGVSLSVPIEMTMRHGTPPILKVLSLGLEPSLSSDVECTMAADFFTQMRSAMTLQRMLVNEAALKGDASQPALLTARDVIRFATLCGAEDLWLGDKVGSLTIGKEADIILLDATALNVAPLNNVPGAVVTLMDRSNVETVIVAGKIRKWKGQLQDANIAMLRSQIIASRDRIFAAARIGQNLFGN
ncbi:MAG: amidohydrolase family protein [Planctomycetaceae bacterium]|nr:amidohydrolase family protein [Planctomycetaceae bacterium]